MGCRFTLVESTDSHDQREFTFQNLRPLSQYNNTKSEFWLDKRGRFWKVHTEEDESTIDMQIKNNERILNLPGLPNGILPPEKIRKIMPRTYVLRQPFAEMDLFDYIKKPFSLDHVLAGLREIAEAIRFLHAHGIAHRDIKTENIVILNSQFKLIDFDYAEESSVFHLCGTEDYMCTFSNKWKCDSRQKSERMDFFAFGITIWSCLFQASFLKMLDPGCIITSKRCDVPNLSGPASILLNVAKRCCQDLELPDKF